MFTFSVAGAGTPFIRGDTDGSGMADLTDGIFILEFLFLGTVMPSCDQAADTDSSELVDLTDPIHLLTFLFIGGVTIEAPHPSCGTALSSLSCESHSGCP